MTLQPPQPSRHRTTDSEERNYQQIRVRQDTNTNWLKNNPVPASGEWCYSIGHRNPPTTYPLDSLPPATKELEGTYILVSNEGETYVYECIAGLGGNGYVWRPRSVEYVEPQYADQCVKIGDGNVRWSELPWLGGRGPQGGVGPEGPQGEKAWGVIYRTVETVSAEGQTIFRLMTTVEPETSMVTINGVVLSPSNYTLTSDLLTLTNSIATKAGDIVSVFSWIGAVESIIAGLNTADIETLSVRPTGIEAKPRSEIKNQQEVNWYLLDKIDDLEIPDGFDPDGLATEEWVLDQSYITEQVVTDAVSNQAADQALIDQEQDREIESIETRVSQIESVSLDARYMFEGDSQIPRDGEFTILKEGASEIAEQWADASVLYFAENALDGSPDWDGVTENDVIRIGGSSVGNIIPTDIQSREADTFAEFRIEAVAGERLFNVSLVRSASQPLAGIEYGVVLLSSFDPSGLATTDFVVSELAKKFDKSGGKVDGLLAVAYSDAPFDNTYTFNVQGSRMPEDANSAFRVTASGSVKAGHDANTPFMAVASNDVVTRGFLEGIVGNLDTGDGSTLDDYAKTDFVLDELSKKLANSGNTEVVQDWRVRSPKGEGSQTYIKISDHQLHLYHVADPTSDEHGINRGYADQRYQIIQQPLVIQTTHSMECVTLTTPGSKQFCGLYNTSPGSSTSANMYFGNWNAGMRVALDGMKTSEGEEFAQGQKYIFNGYVNVVGKEDGRLYFKHAVDMIQRSGTDNYLTIHFSNRVATYATGENGSQDKFVVTIEGYINKQVATVSMPEETE